MPEISLIQKSELCPTPCSPCGKPPEAEGASLWLGGFDDNRLDGLPASGTITFRYKRRNKEVSTRTDGGKEEEKTNVRLELTAIVDVSAPADTAFRSVGEALAAWHAK